MDPTTFPSVPADLITALERQYPERTPELSEPLDAIRYRSGQVAVVRHLRAVFEAQNLKHQPHERFSPNVQD